MKKAFSLLNPFPLFLFLAGLYPVLFLWSVNFYQVKSYVLYRSLTISLGFTLVIFLLSVLFFKSIIKGSLFSLVVLIVFFSYGHIYSIVEDRTVLGIILGRHRFLVVANLILVFYLGFIIYKKRKIDSIIISRLNLLFGLMLTLLLLQIGYKYANTSNLTPTDNVSTVNSSNSNSLEVSATKNSTRADQPDVYYLILDAYSRGDVLAEQGYDNNDFITKLKAMGFIIPECGQSNYNYTAMTLSSTLNMDYLENLGVKLDTLERLNMNTVLESKIKNSLVRQKFHDLGYQFVTSFQTHSLYDISDSDVYFHANLDSRYISSETIETFKFQELFMNTTLALVINDWLDEDAKNTQYLPSQVLMVISPTSLNLDTEEYGFPHYFYYQINRYTLDDLIEIPEIPGKKFIYLHNFITHTPYLFTPSGEFDGDNENSLESYHNTITYLNSRLLESDSGDSRPITNSTCNHFAGRPFWRSE